MKTGVGLFITPKCIYAAEVQKQMGPMRLVKSAETEFSPPASGIMDKGLIISKIKETLQKAEITASAVVSGLSGSEAIIRFFEMPILPKGERKNAIRFESQKYVSFDTKELYYNHDVLIDHQTKRMRVLFLGAKKDTVESHLAILQDAGLKAAALEPASLSLIRTLSNAAPFRDSDTNAVFDLHKDGTVNIIVVKDRLLLLSRDCNIINFQENPPRPDYASLASEVRLTFSYFERNFKNEQLKRLILCVDPEGDFQGWDEKLRGEFSLPVQIGNVPGLFGKPNALSPGMVIAIGLAMRQLEVGIGSALSLMPHESVKFEEAAAPMAPEEEKKLIQKYSISSLIGVILLVFALHFFLSWKTSEMKRGISTTQTLEELGQKEMALLKKAGFFNTLFSQRVYWTTKANELTKMVPNEFELQSLDYKNQENDSSAEAAMMHLEWTEAASDPGSALLQADAFVKTLKANKDFMSGFSEIKMRSGRAGKSQMTFSADCA